MNNSSLAANPLVNKINRLGGINRNLNAALEEVANLCDFQMCANVDHDPCVNLLETAAERVGKLIKFKASSFYLVEEESADFVIAYTTCTIQSVLLSDEMDRLINERIFNWALKRKKSTIVKAKKNGETLLMHPLVTAKRVRGFFIAFLAEKAHEIADYRIDLFGLVLFNCANYLESYNIYQWNKGISTDLHEKIARLSAVTIELQQYREGLEVIVEERTVDLKKANNCLEKEIEARLKIQEELSRNQIELENRVIERTDALEKIQGQMIVHEKLAAIGQLSAGIAHEFNNPINFIRTNFSCLHGYFLDLIDLLNLYVRLEDLCVNNIIFQSLTKLIQKKKTAIQNQFIIKEIPNIFKESEIGFKRIEEIIMVMRNFCRNGTQDTPVYFDLNQIVREASTLSLTLFQSVVRFTTELGAIPVTLGFPELLKDVLLNIFLNSIQAFESQDREKVGLVAIKTWHDQGAIWCTVSDDGPGILKTNQLYIFDPFYTTKDPGKGKGLGLSTAYDIITNKHQGKLIVDCPTVGGTIFTICLPLVTNFREDEHARES